MTKLLIHDNDELIEKITSLNTSHIDYLTLFGFKIKYIPGIFKNIKSIKTLSLYACTFDDPIKLVEDLNKITIMTCIIHTNEINENNKIYDNIEDLRIFLTHTNISIVDINMDKTLDVFSNLQLSRQIQYIGIITLDVIQSGIEILTHNKHLKVIKLDSQTDEISHEIDLLDYYDNTVKYRRKLNHMITQDTSLTAVITDEPLDTKYIFANNITLLEIKIRSSNGEEHLMSCGRNMTIKNKATHLCTNACVTLMLSRLSCKDVLRYIADKVYQTRNDYAWKVLAAQSIPF